jgi:hypothetical protein
MITDLFAAASGMSPDTVITSIPPAVRRPLGLPVGARSEGADIVIEFPAFRPRHPASHLVPSFSALTEEDYSFRFEAAAAGAGSEAWVSSVSIGAARFDAIPEANDALRSETDFFVAATPLPLVRLRLRLRAAKSEAVLRAPWLVTLSACDGGPVETPRPTPGPPVSVGVPPLSQIEEDARLRQRVCSPVSVAMVLRSRGRAVSVTDLAAEMFHPGLDLYGVWPCAIQAAARRGLLGYLLRFPDWTSAAWCLDQGLPIVASVRYGAGELTGAAIAATSGHLVVLTGFEGGEILVNDPAAPTKAEVARRYRLDEFARVWLERAGVGYVFWAPPGG